MSRFIVVLMLAWVAGFVDASGFIILSHIFTSHMSGNTVAAAAYFGTGQWARLAHRMLPIPIFVFGVFGGVLAGALASRCGARRDFAPAFMLEMGVLGAYAALGAVLQKQNGIFTPPRAYPLVGLLAAAMGLQNATLRRAGGIVVRTTFVTGMLVNMSEHAAQYVLLSLRRLRTPVENSRQNRLRSACRMARIRTLQLGSIWSTLFVGGCCGGYCTLWLGTNAVLIPLGVLLIIVARDIARPLSAK